MDGTVSDVADLLGVSPRQVQMWAAEGRLQVTRRIGRSMMIDYGSAYALSRGAGRRWEANTAWAAIDLLTSQTTARLAGAQLSRLRRRLDQVTVANLVYRSADRAHVTRYRQTRGRADDLHTMLVVTGTTALADTQIAAIFGLVPGAATVLDGYAATDDVAELTDQFGLVADSAGDIVLHATDQTITWSPVTIALDLYERGTTREHAAAASLLQHTLTTWHHHQPSSHQVQT